MENIDWMNLAIKVFLGIVTSCFALEITPIKLNPVSWFCRRIANNVNKDRDQKLSEIERKLDEHIKHNKNTEAISSRTNIIRFAEDLKYKKIPSQEHFNIIMEDVDFYEKYCATHTDFPNNKCTTAINFIKKMYKMNYFHD